jgi:hypothetical protein
LAPHNARLGLPFAKVWLASAFESFTAIVASPPSQIDDKDRTGPLYQRRPLSQGQEKKLLATRRPARNLRRNDLFRYETAANVPTTPNVAFTSSN